MKQKLIYLISALIIGVFAASCSEDKPSGQSIFNDEESAVTEFDGWLEMNYIRQYNIRFIYRLLDIESDMAFWLVPADYEQSIRMAKVTKHALLGAYDELVGVTFLKKYFPKMIILVGNNAYNNLGQMTLGQAEGGMKITLYGINDMDFRSRADINVQFSTCHHEFAHILHQTIMFAEDYREISGADYLGDSWSQLSYQSALNQGFISEYSSKEYTEDFVEIYAIFVTSTPEEWENTLGQASEEGRAKIEQKLEIVGDYFLNTWGIDVYEMRNTVLRRMDELSQLDLDNL